MSLDLNTHADFLKTRVDKTLSLQNQIAESWLWPVKTAAEWQTDSTQLDKSQPGTLAAKAITAETRADSARGQLDQRHAEMHRQTLVLGGVMRVRALRSPEHVHVVDELSARGCTRRTIEDEGAALLSAWSEEFSPNFAPAPDLTYNGFKALFTGDATATPPVPTLRVLNQTLSDASTVARRETGRLNALLTRADIPTTQYHPPTQPPGGPASPLNASRTRPRKPKPLPWIWRVPGQASGDKMRLRQ
jgi:hypothetical protein